MKAPVGVRMQGQGPGGPRKGGEGIGSGSLGGRSPARPRADTSTAPGARPPPRSMVPLCPTLPALVRDLFPQAEWTTNMLRRRSTLRARGRSRPVPDRAAAQTSLTTDVWLWIRYAAKRYSRSSCVRTSWGELGGPSPGVVKHSTDVK